jgi:hypothetical protein
VLRHQSQKEHGLSIKTLFYRQHSAESNAGLSLRAEQFNHLKSANKCFAFSLSLSGTASALGTLAVMPVTQAIQVASLVAAFFIPTTLCILLSPILQSSAKRVLSDIPSN